MSTCLIVDDSKIVRQVVRRIMEALGFAILEADNGRDAVDAVRANQVDVMILDWNMPVMDGMECMQLIRTNPSIHQPKIMFCTTENELSKIQMAMMNGADEYVMKPFDEAILVGKLQQLGMIESGNE